jgi:glycosyltransferase involved in cell wall biosynthesis
VEIVLQAVKRLRLQDALQDYQIIIMGEGSERARLEALCTELALDSRVRFTGYVSNAQRDSLYARCRIVVYPSLAEPFGLPCIEAGLYAKPVIASHRGGPATIIENGETGLTVDMTQQDKLADAIKHLIDHPDAAAKMGTAARQHLEPIYGLENWTANLEAKLLALKTTYHT